MFSIEEFSARYDIFEKQNGFKNAGDARPSHWLLVADGVIWELSKELAYAKGL